MNTSSRSNRHRSLPASRQRGIALVVALILLVVATLTGMAGIRSATLQEKMSGNMYDRSLAMQAAEAALRAAEDLIADDPDSVPGRIDCRAAPCPVVPLNAFTPGDSTNWQDVAGDFSVNADRMGSTPQFLIQWIDRSDRSGRDRTGQSFSANCIQAGPDCSEPPKNTYRVTARSGVPTAMNDRAVVVLNALIRER